MSEQPAFCKAAKCTLVQSNSGVEYDLRFGDYSIAVDAEAKIRQQLFFCLWCGAELPPSRRDDWFDQLERRGVDPWGQDVPEEFRTDAWRTS
jgi:hypothetical protein